MWESAMELKVSWGAEDSTLVRGSERVEGVRSWRAGSSSVTTLSDHSEAFAGSGCICQQRGMQKIKQVGRTQAPASQNAL